MKKRISIEQKNEKMVADMINKMFEVAEHAVSYNDVKDRKDDWYTHWSMSVEQNDEWKNWGEKYLIKEFKMSKKYAERQMGMISLMWGLKFSNFNL